MSVDAGPSVHGHPVLVDSPIPAAWVLSGSPRARVHSLASHRGATQVSLWDCTAGSFTWEFGPYDETVHILEGAVLVVDPHGTTTRLLCAGDVALFPAWSTSTWTIDTNGKKLAVLHDRRSRVRRALGVRLSRFRPREGGL